MSYDITTKLGSELLRKLGTNAGASVTATDGSVWTRQADGSVVARGISGDTAVVRDLYKGSAAAANDAIADAAARNKARTKELEKLYKDGTDKMASYLAEAAQVAAQNQIAQYNAQKESVQSQYEKMLRQLYIEREQSEQNLAQLLASAGLSGGASESTQLGLDTAYMNALQDGANERDAALRELDRAIASARYDAQMRAMEAYADAQKTRLSGYASAIKAAIAEENAARDAVFKQADSVRDYALGLAQKILASGGTPSEDLLRAAQLSDADAAALYVAPEVEEEKPLLTLAQAISAIQNGTVSEAVQNAYDYYMGEGAYDRFASTVAAQKKTAASKKSSSGGSTAKSKEEKAAERAAKKQADLEDVRFTYDARTGEYTLNGRVFKTRGEFVFALRQKKLTTAQKDFLDDQCKAYRMPKIKFVDEDEEE